MHTRRPGPVDAGAILVGASALLVVVGAAAVWVSGPAGTLTGVSLFETGHPAVNGPVTACLASVGTLLALFFPHSNAAAGLTAVVGLTIELIAVAVVVAPAAALDDASVGTALTTADLGLGIPLTLVGGLGVLLGGVLAYRRNP